MWELFDQFLSELKTVTVSFKEEKALQFPSFAFCDKYGFKEKIGITSNATLYNASTYHFEEELRLDMVDNAFNLTGTYVVESFPTTSNGYCTLYEFRGKHKVGANPGE